MTRRERILAHLDGWVVDRLPCLPITMMFAAELIDVPYKDYATNCKNLVKGQIAVAEKFGIDYVNTMSDPACEAADCGAEVVFYDNQPPALHESRALLQDKTRLVHLQIPDPTKTPRMSNRLRALQMYSEQVGGELLIEGWVEGPCAQAADLRGINNLMYDFIDDPTFVHDLFEFVVEMELRFARHQLIAGAESIGIGDAASSLVGPKIYKKFVWPYQKRMVDEIHALGMKVRLHICGNTTSVLDQIAKLGCDIVELDSMVPISRARDLLGNHQIVMGNVDPVRILLEGDPMTVRRAFEDCHNQAGSRYMVAAGCEIPRGTPHENFKAMVDYAYSHAPDSQFRLQQTKFVAG